METIYLITAIVYGIFIIRFILSCFGGDFDIDNFDLDLSDIVSFKGVTHFLMGFTGWLSTKQVLTDSIVWYDFLIAFCIGIIFVLILFYLYKFMMKLEHKGIILSKDQLVGQDGKVYLYLGSTEDKKYKYQVTVYNGAGTVEIDAISDKIYAIGDIVLLKEYKGTYYLI